MMVRVPFGRKEVDGYCVEVTETSTAEKIRTIREILDEDILKNRGDKVLVDPNMLKLTRWIADYYFSSWGAALDCAVPVGVKENKQGRLIEIASLAVDEDRAREAAALYREKSPARARVIEALRAAGEAMPVAQLRAEADCSASPIKTLAKDGLLYLVKEHTSHKHSLRTLRPSAGRTSTSHRTRRRSSRKSHGISTGNNSARRCSTA